MEPVTLITGGSSGIGAATARALLKQGHRVAITGRDTGRLDAFAASAEAGTGTGAGERLLTIRGDASDERHVAAAVRQVAGWWGRLDTVIANAGFSLPGTLEDHDPQAMRAMVLTNVLGPALLVRETLPHLRESKGRIVIVGSVAGIRNTPGNLYSVTKWATHALAENVRLLVAKDGVGVTLVAAGIADTAFWDERGGVPEAGADVNHLVVRPVGQVG